MDNDQSRSPFFSVVIPLYNKAEQIGKTLESVFAQTFTDYEIVIVDDGSTDNSVEAALAKAKDFDNLRFIRQQNAGVSAARNRGIEEALGKYIALLDADDEWKPDYLATQAELIRKYPECDVFATNYEFLNEEGETKPPVLNHIYLSDINGVLNNYFQIASSSQPPLWTSAVCFSKKAIISVEGFPVGVRLGEDLITWAKLACKYQIAYSKNICATYHNTSQKKRLIPRKKPNEIDIVSQEYDKLIEVYNIPYLKHAAARWHKIRMVTFVQLQQRKKAREHYDKIKQLVIPDKKDRLWYILSFMPIQFTRFFLKYKHLINK